MKRETISTFEEGLNKDLNPIVTPNNVLTDNLNGTFLTFNGDELSLQNDAGNTKIFNLINEETQLPEYVKLTEGFEPLGIKEYGGVLYVVSGKKYYEDGIRIHEKDEFEIGSYPSPEDARYRSFSGTSGTIDTDSDEQVLYKSLLLNSDEFKSGRSINFDDKTLSGVNIANLWTPNRQNKLYIVKLLLFLNNGTIDLTEDIWARFEEHNSGKTHWLVDDTFWYHCPFSFKGKLMLKIELNEPVFKVSEYYNITKQDDGKYQFLIDVETKDNPNNNLKIDGYEVSITTDNIFFDNSEVSVINQTNLGDNKTRITYSIDPNYGGLQTTKMQYKIWPKFKYEGNELPWNLLPYEFTSRYQISGTMVLNAKLNLISLTPEGGSCNNSKMVADFLTLTGPDLEYVNISGGSDLVDAHNPNGLPYTFIREGLDRNLHSGDYIFLGEFSIDGTKANITFDEGTLLNSNDKYYLEEKAKSTDVIYDHWMCAERIAIKLLFDMSLPTINGKLFGMTIKLNGTEVGYTLTSNNSQVILDNIPIMGQITIESSYSKRIFFMYNLDENSGEILLKLPLIVDGPQWQIVGDTEETMRIESNVFPNELKILGNYIANQFSTTMPDQIRAEINIMHPMYESEKGTLHVKDGNGGWYFWFPIKMVEGAAYWAPGQLDIYFKNIQEIPQDEYYIDTNTSLVRLGTYSLGYFVFPKIITVIR